MVFREEYRTGGGTAPQRFFNIFRMKRVDQCVDIELHHGFEKFPFPLRFIPGDAENDAISGILEPRHQRFRKTGGDRSGNPPQNHADDMASATPQQLCRPVRTVSERTDCLVDPLFRLFRNPHLRVPVEIHRNQRPGNSRPLRHIPRRHFVNRHAAPYMSRVILIIHHLLQKSNPLRQNPEFFLLIQQKTVA